MKNAYESITYEDLTCDLQILAGTIGVDLTAKLMKECSGYAYYIPKLATLKNFCIEYVKNNLKEPDIMIARQLNCTANFIKQLRKIISED